MQSPPLRKFTIPGLDGLRALAVMAVVFFHGGIQHFFPGGYLGVDLFFSISGFLITRLMIDEYSQTNRFDVIAFLGRRFKRLYPVLLMVLFASAVYASLFARDSLSAIRADLGSSLFYYSNYDQLAHELPYFEQFMRPHPFQHLWSLAVEMHFYLVWPLLFLGYALYPKGFKIFALLLALGFTVWSLDWAISMHVPIEVKPEKFYFRTDTRVADILIGAVLAFYFNPRRLESPDGRQGAVLMCLGVTAFAGLLWAFLKVDESSYGLYRGGFTLVSLATCVLIILGVMPHTIFYRLLNLSPLVWLGRRSYSLYLWHWPVFAFFRPGDELPDSPIEALVIRVAIALALSELSYRFIERKFQGRMVTAYGRGSVPVYGAFLLSFIALMVYINESSVSSPKTQEAPAIGMGSLPPSTHVGDSDKALNSPNASSEEGHSPRTYPLAATDIRVTAIGDSVLLGAKPALQSYLPIAKFDAVVGRQGSDALKLMKELAATHQLSDEVLLHIGTNGYIYEQHLKQILELLSDKKAVVIFNVHADRRWTEPNNQLLEKYRALYPQYTFVDWHQLSDGHPEYFVKDGIHLTSAGMTAFASLAKRAFKVPDPPKEFLVREPQKPATPTPVRPKVTLPESSEMPSSKTVLDQKESAPPGLPPETSPPLEGAPTTTQ